MSSFLGLERYMKLSCEPRLIDIFCTGTMETLSNTLETRSNDGAATFKRSGGRTTQIARFQNHQETDNLQNKTDYLQWGIHQDVDWLPSAMYRGSLSTASRFTFTNSSKAPAYLLFQFLGRYFLHLYLLLLAVFTIRRCKNLRR